MSTRFGSTPSNNALSLKIDEEATVRGTLDPEVLVRLQMNRCNIALTSGDTMTFGNSVMALLSMLPSDRRKLVQERKIEYTTTTPTYKYKYINGWKIGSPENPRYKNLPEDDDYNPNIIQVKTRTVKKKEKIINTETNVEEEIEYDVEEEYESKGEPVLISPKIENIDTPDYYKLYLIIQDSFELAGLTWKIEQITEDGGDWKDDEDTPPPPPNPTDEDGQTLNKGEEKRDTDTDE